MCVLITELSITSAGEILSLEMIHVQTVEKNKPKLLPWNVPFFFLHSHMNLLN